MINPAPPAPHSFTIRVPRELHLELCEVAAVENLALNTKVNQLLRLGLGKHISLNATLSKMLARMIVEEDGA